MRTPLVACSIQGVRRFGRVTPATLAAFLRRSMGGCVLPAPPGQSIGPRAGAPSTAWARLRSRGRPSPGPRGRTPQLSRRARTTPASEAAAWSERQRPSVRGPARSLGCGPCRCAAEPAEQRRRSTTPTGSYHAARQPPRGLPGSPRAAPAATRLVPGRRSHHPTAAEATTTTPS
jgi:hypothetical protein